jgi:hypothetical protein
LNDIIANVKIDPSPPSLSGTTETVIGTNESGEEIEQLRSVTTALRKSKKSVETSTEQGRETELGRGIFLKETSS